MPRINLAALHSVAALCLSLSLTSCGGGGGGAAAGATTEPQVIVGNAQTVTGAVGPAGATLRTSDSSIALTIPSGSLPTSTNISVAQSTASVPIGAIGGSIVDLGPTGTVLKATLQVQYSPSLLPTGIPENSLTLAALVGDKWTDIPTDVNISTKTLTAQLAHFSTYAIKPADTTTVPYGQVLGDLNGVTIYSNGCLDPSTPACGSIPDTYNSNNAGGYTTGLQWQCVEFVVRYYYQLYGMQIRIPGTNADDYYRTAPARGLLAFPNGGTTPPQAGDIIVSEGLPSNLGHVAIVRSVASDIIYVAEQNWFQNAGNLNHPLTLNVTAGHYTVGNFSSNSAYPVTGWLRRPITLQPGPTTGGKDIWTTSTYSYAPSGGGPGGGLNDDTLRVGGWFDEYRSLLQFNVSNASLPVSASKVILRLYSYNNNGGSPTPMTLLKITQAWDWTTTGTGSDKLRLWWVDQPNATPLVAFGSRATTLPAPTLNSFYDVEITDQYNAWKSNPGQNFGLELRPILTSNNWNYFYSSDYLVDPSKRPQLIITP
jgi:surface antigen